MRSKLSDAEVMGIGIGGFLAIGVAGLLGAVRGDISQANAALALVLVVVLAAFTGGRWAGVSTGIVAAISFDFFLTAPFRSLAISSRDDLITTGLLSALGLAVGHITATRWSAKVEGRDAHDELAAIHRLAGLAVGDADTATVIAETETAVAKVLRLSSCRFARLPHDPPLPDLQPTGRASTPLVYAGDGFLLPSGGVTMAVRSQGDIHGWLTCHPADDEIGISSDRRRTALILADQLGLVLAAEGLSTSGQS